MCTTKTQQQRKRLAREREIERRRQFNNEPALFRRLKRDKQGVEVQEWGIDATHQLVYAGVHFIPEINARWLYRLHTNWQRWRKWYDSLPENAHDYPTKRILPVAFYGAHPIDEPRAVKWLEATPAAQRSAERSAAL